MPPDASAAPASALPTTTRVTRSSIRHSLTLASVGKALADVMNKSDPKGGGGDDRAKRTKEKDMSSRRSSTIGSLRGKDANKPLSADKPPASAPSKDATPSPDVKTITRKTRAATASNTRVGSSSSEEQSDRKSTISPPGIAPVTRSSSLRAKRNSVSTTLPKYKPKAGLDTIKEPPSPPRKVVRKRANSSDDDDKEDKSPKSPGLDPPSPLDKIERPISPLPKRAAFNLTSAMNVSPSPTTPTTPTKKLAKGATPARMTPSSKPSPTRSLKTKTVESATKQGTARPPSAASSVSSVRTRTPTKTPPTSLRTAFGLGKTKSTQPQSPLRKVVKGKPGVSAASSVTNSPKSVSAKSTTSKSDTNRAPTVTVNLGDSSTDSMDADDVEFMLSAIASPTAPTPAMPRFRPPPMLRDRTTNKLPETPSRAGKTVGSRSQTFLSPIPQSTDNSPLFPRVSNMSKNRQSILSWEQLTASNKSLGEDEIDHMLADVPAPFNASSGPSLLASPVRMNLDIPDSPMLSALPSPGGFTSISQVLLPDATPSPLYGHTAHLYDSAGPDIPAVDGAITTLLRLQLASAEQLVQERQARIDDLEKMLGAAQEARAREEEELARQVGALEEQFRNSMAVRERTNEEKEVYIGTLHEQLSQVEAAREQAVEQAVVETQASAQVAFNAAIVSERRRWEIADLAKGTAVQWINVGDIAEGELEFVRSSRETLTVLLAGLEESRKRLQSLNC